MVTEQELEAKKLETQRLEEMMSAKDAEVARVRLEKDMYFALHQEFISQVTSTDFELEKLRRHISETESAKRATEERAKLLQRKLEKEEQERRYERDKLVRALEDKEDTEETEQVRAEKERLEAHLDRLSEQHERMKQDAEARLKSEQDAIAQKQEEMEKVKAQLEAEVKEKEVRSKGPHPICSSRFLAPWRHSIVASR